MNRKKLLAAGAVGLAAFYTPPGVWARQQLLSLATGGPRVASMLVSWSEVSGSTGYEISVDGQVVGLVNRNARSYAVDVGQAALVEVVDLPARSLVQVIDFQQTEGQLA